MILFGLLDSRHARLQVITFSRDRKNLLKNLLSLFSSQSIKVECSTLHFFRLQRAAHSCHSAIYVISISLFCRHRRRCCRKRLTPPICLVEIALGLPFGSESFSLLVLDGGPYFWPNVGWSAGTSVFSGLSTSFINGRRVDGPVAFIFRFLV